MQEESGETVCSDGNGVAKWLCPLCQQEQPDRGSLSQHLTDRHSVLPTCVDKLLDIAAPKRNESGEEDPGSQNTTDTESSHLKHASNSPTESCQPDETSEPEKYPEVDAELERMGEPERDGVNLESHLEKEQTEELAKMESADNNDRTAGKNGVVAESVDSRPFRCSACLEAFPTKTALSVHYNSTSHIQRMRTGSSNQGGENDNPSLLLPSLSRPFISTKPYQCAVCRVSYNHAITLESHMKSVLHQTRSRNAASSAAGNAGSTGGNNNKAPSLVVTSGGGASQMVPASSSNCIAPGNLTAVVTTAKDGDQIQTVSASSLLSSPVASSQAISAFLTLLTSSPGSLPHSLLPSLFAAGAGPGAATTQLIPQPQMLMPMILNGLAQSQGLGSDAQHLTQSMPLLGLNAAQQALLAQRLGTLHTQWPTLGLPTTLPTSSDDRKEDVKSEEETAKEEGKCVSERGSPNVKVEEEDNLTMERAQVKTEMGEEEDKKFAHQLKDGKKNRFEACIKEGDNEMADRDSTTDGRISGPDEGGDIDKCGGKLAKPNLTLSPMSTDKTLLNDNRSPSVSVPSNFSSSPVNLNLTLSPDSTPQKSQAGTSPCTSVSTPKSSPFRCTLTFPDQTRHLRNPRGWHVSPGLPTLSEFQSQVLLAFLESRSEADAVSPPHEDCEALGKEVGLSEGEVRRWLCDARNAKERQKALATQNRRSTARYARRDRGTVNNEKDRLLAMVESEASGSQAMDLSSSGGRRKETPAGSCLTSDSDNEEVYTSVIVSDEDSQSAFMREQPDSPVREELRSDPAGDKGSGGGKVLRSTTVFLSDAEDEDDDEEAGAQKAKRRKRRRELEREEVEIKRERLDPDVDLELEAQADPPNPLQVAMDHPGLPSSLLQSLPLSLSLAPFSTQFLSPYVLSLPSSVVGVGVAEGDGGKAPAFPSPPNVTRFSDPLLTPSLSSYRQSSPYLPNGEESEAALDLSMGKSHSTTQASSSLSSMVDKTSVQKGRLLDGLGLRPTAKGLIVVQVKPDPAGNTSTSNSGGFINSNNMSKPSTVYMRAAERMNATLVERERERAKVQEQEKEKEKDKEQRKSKGKRYRDMRRSRTIIQAEQLDVLYGCYFKDPNPGKNEFEQISEWVHLPKKVVQIWFQNMRARERKGEVRFVSDGTLAAVGKPLIKFTWPLSKPIFSTLPKSNASFNSSGSTAATPVRTLLKPDKEPAKEKVAVKSSNPVPFKPKDAALSTVSSVSSSVSAVPKTKLETTSNITMVKIAPKITPPILPAAPKETLPVPTRSPQKRKMKEESGDEERTDEEYDGSEEKVGPAISNRMVPKLTSTPINKPPSAAQKQNGLSYWSPKGAFKINTLSREQLGLSVSKPRTITPAPVPSMTTSPTTTSHTTTTSSSTTTTSSSIGRSGTDATTSSPSVPKPTESSFLHHSTSRRPRTHLSCLQLSILQSCYETCAHPNALECEAIGTELGLPLKVVQIWFQNTRAKEKRWRLQQEKLSPSSDPAKKVDTSSGSYLHYNALRANRPILPKPVQLSVVEPSSPPPAGQPAARESLRGRCEACSVAFQSRAAARAHVFSPRHLATLRTTNFGQPATGAVVNNNGSAAGSSSVTGSGSGGETVESSPPQASSTS
ncbi:zinc finger homeobox protein 4 [Osmerus eperlanus]|uniref:zinc finger homeobox protein 4 n=1 Tax=Osmerus eperlanus TaxID=29151 RepID=UPI002E123A26